LTVAPIEGLTQSIRREQRDGKNEMARKKCLAEKRGTAQSGEILALRSIERATHMPERYSL
jgi:hypothetical protein